MKKIISCIICAVMLIGLLPVSANAAGVKEIAAYGSFETKPSNAFSATMRSTGYSQDCARTGNVSIKVAGQEGHPWALIFFRPSLESGKTYHFSLYAFSTGGASEVISAEAEYYINGARKTVSIRGDSFIPVGKWSEFAGNFTINEAEGSTIANTSIKVSVKGNHNVYIDDVTVYEGSRDINTKQPDDNSKPEKIVVSGDTLDLYVDQNATDGGDGSKEKPFNSLFTARDYVRTINKNMKQNIAVNVMGGFYEMTETLNLTDEDSGTNGYHVIWRAAEGEDVTLSGGKRVTGWVESEIPGVYKTSHDGDNLRQLYVNDKVAQRARYNEYVTPLAWYDDTEDTLSKRDGVIIPKGIINNPEKATNLELTKNINFVSSWVVKGKAIDSEQGTIISFPQPRFSWEEKARTGNIGWNITDDFRLENALEFLDEPGEWFQDIDTDTLYYKPLDGENIFESEVVAPTLENMIEVSGESTDNRAENIVISGFTIAHGANDFISKNGRMAHQSTTIWSYDLDTGYQSGWNYDRANINVTNSKNVLFEKNTIKHMGSVGIHMLCGVVNCEVTGNAFYEMSNSAVVVGSSEHANLLDWESLPHNITISNNILTEISQEVLSSPAIQVYYANGAYILHNVVYNVTYSGICAGWGWQRTNLPQRRTNIIGNRIWNTNTMASDGAPIYTLGENENSTLQYNFVSYKPGNLTTGLLYHDEGSSDFYNYRNVVDVSNNLENWISPYRPEMHDIVLAENYASHLKRSYNAPDTIETKTQVNPDGSWSKEARYAISQSGLEDGFEYLYDLVPNYSEQSELRHVTLQTKEYDYTNPVRLKEGEVVNLRTLYEPLNGELYFKDTYTSVESTDTSVLRCDGGKITAVGSGIATVYATTEDGYRIGITMTVNDEGKNLDLFATKEEIPVGSVTYLKYNLNTKFWCYSDVEHEFISSNPHIASVDDMGVVRGLMNGKTRLTLRVTFDGKVFEDSVDLKVKEAGATATLSLDKHIYEINEDTKLSANISIGDKVTPVTDSNAYAEFEDAIGTKATDEVSKKYTTEMMYLYNNALIDGSRSASDKVTEEQFVSMLEKVIGRERETFYVTADNKPLTREKMAYILSQALRYVWGNTMEGDKRLSRISDREKVSTEMIPYVANAVKYELLFITNAVSEFRPKDIATLAEGAATIYRLMNPKEIRNYEYPDCWFNRGIEAEKIHRNGHSIVRNKTNMVLTEKTASLSGSGLALPKAIGSYKVNLKVNYNGKILENNDFCFIYDKNDILDSNEYKTASYGDGASGIILNENENIRMITTTENVWGNEDSFTYMYKEIKDKAYEVSTTVESITNTHADAAAGIMVRAAESADSVKIDYRIKPSGDTFLCWRTTKGAQTSFVQGKRIQFPATLKLVKNGGIYTAYYKQGDEWIKNASFEDASLDCDVRVGLMTYGMSVSSGRPCSAIFGNTYFGEVRNAQDLEVAQKPEVKPEEKPEEVVEKVEFNRDRYLDFFKNGSFEQGISGWGAGDGSVSVSGESYKGNKSIKFTPNGGSGGYITFNVPGLQKNKKYYMIFRAKTSEGTASFTPYIQYYNGSAHVRCTTKYLTSMKAVSDEWKEFIIEMSFDTTPSSELLVIYAGTKSDVYYDCIEMLYQ